MTPGARTGACGEAPVGDILSRQGCLTAQENRGHVIPYILLVSFSLWDGWVYECGYNKAREARESLGYHAS